MKKGALFKTVRVVVVLSVSVVLALALIKYRPRAEKKVRIQAGRPVRVVETAAQSIPMFVETYGTVAPREVLTLVAEVPGQVVKLHPDFKAGGFVKKGEPLIEIDQRKYRLEVDLGRAGIRQAEAEIKKLIQEIENLKASLKIALQDLALAETEVNRLEKLAKRDMAAQSVLDKARRQQLSSRERLQAIENQLALTAPIKEQLETGMQRAKVMLDQALLNLEKTTITAPYDAWITEKKVEKGLVVNAGQPAGILFRANAFDISAHIPVDDLQWIQNGNNTLVGLKAQITFSGVSPPVMKTGTVTRVKAALDATTRTLPLIVEVDSGLDPHPTSKGPGSIGLKAGMFVTITIKSDREQLVHKLPRHMIHDNDRVYLVKDGQLRIQQVNVLRRFKKTVFVTSGLNNGDLVIATPVANAVSGMKITLMPKTP